MRSRRRFSVLALWILAATGFATAGAVGAQGPGNLDRSVVAAAEREQRCRLSEGEVAVMGGAGGAAPLQTAARKGITGETVVAGDRFVILDVGRDAAGVDFDDPTIAPVFRAGSAPDAPFLFPTGEVIVRFRLRTPEERAVSWGAARGLALVRPLEVRSAFLFRAATPAESLEAAAEASASEEVAFCAPNWMRQVSARHEDPLYPFQWHLKNTGEVWGTVAGNDVNVESVWGTYRGSPGQVICVVDFGLEIAHRDLAANVIPGLSWDFVTQTDVPTPGEHATAVGGVAAARGYNGIGVRGVAPEAGLCGYRILGRGEATDDAMVAEAETRACDRISVHNNSWGPPDTGTELEAPKELAEAAMTQGVAGCRGGRGALYVWAGGNGLLAGDNSNYDGFANWRYTIAVGATTSGGKQAFYSEPGANLCVNAPADGGGDTGVATTDLTGPAGYNRTGVAQGNFADLDCTNNFGGTSSATPVVSGVCALMLQANPDLGWRDVKKILMATASKNDPTDADWTPNAGGYPVNHKYGFGRVDAAAAVIAATAWTNLPPEVSAEVSASPGQSIPLGARGVSSTIRLDRSIDIESVEVYFTADHPNWGDLSVVLTAPSGTSSVLAEKHDTSGTQSRFDNWRFGTERHLGEMSAGDWTLTVRDLGTTGGGTFSHWRLVAYGTDPGAEVVSLTTAASPTAGGEVSPAGTIALYRGVQAGIAATPAPGYYFREWTASPPESVEFGFGGQRAPETTVTLSADATLTAVFSSTPPATATVDFAAFPGWGGIVDPGERAEVNLGSGIALMVLPAATYRFVGWAAEPASHAEFASAGSTNTIALIKGDVQITAVFRGPRIALTQGSVLRVPAAYLAIPAFTRAPKVTGSTPRKSYPMKVIGEFPSETLSARWPGVPRIYEPADYKDPAKGLGALLEEAPVAPLGLRSLLIDASKADGKTLDLAEVSDCALVPPVIERIEPQRGNLAEESYLLVVGSHFGTKPPKVSVEYTKNGKFFTKACAAADECPYQDTSGKPSCMDPLLGDSEAHVLYPRLPAGAVPTGYFILENAIGMCSFYRTAAE